MGHDSLRFHVPVTHSNGTLVDKGCPRKNALLLGKTPLVGNRPNARCVVLWSAHGGYWVRMAILTKEKHRLAFPASAGEVPPPKKTNKVNIGLRLQCPAA